jgi:fatty-acyl-CoA synthase
MGDTMIDLLEQAADLHHKGYTFLDASLNARPWTFAEMVRETQARAEGMRELGLRAGDRVGLVAPDPEDFVFGFLAAIQAGVMPVPMYPPFALDRLDAYVDQAARILEVAQARALFTTKSIGSLLWSLVSKVPSLETVHALEKLRNRRPPRQFEPHRPRPEDPCFLQFTSGSTSTPKGVMVSHENLVANATAIMKDGVNADPEKDHGVSWLPLYHDMGLIGFVVSPMLQQIRVTFIPTELFVRRPNVWMETIHAQRGTITFAPNFAFGLAAKRISKSKLAELDLSCLRVVGCGAEPINPDTLRLFQNTFSAAGLRPEAIMPAYGMAEATLAITFDTLDAPFSTLRLDRSVYESERRAVVAGPDVPEERVMELVSCGRAFPGHRVGVRDDDGSLLEEGQVGELVLRGPSNTAGYYRSPEATAALLQDGWLHTGDLGFILDGEVYVSGRKKDMIILNGRNHYPQSIEWELERIEGIRKGNVVAFGIAGSNSEEVVIAAETRSEDLDQLRRTVKKQVHDAFGVRPRDVVLLPPGSLPKTSSGKLQRRKAKDLYEEASLGSEGNRTIGSAASRWAIARHVTASAVARLTHGVRGKRASGERANKDEHRE